MRGISSPGLKSSNIIFQLSQDADITANFKLKVSRCCY
jgi:hypothetical protein